MQAEKAELLVLTAEALGYLGDSAPTLVPLLEGVFGQLIERLELATTAGDIAVAKGGSTRSC